MMRMEMLRIRKLKRTTGRRYSSGVTDSCRKFSLLVRLWWYITKFYCLRLLCICQVRSLVLVLSPCIRCLLTYFIMM